jgi:hypothetical protein
VCSVLTKAGIDIWNIQEVMQGLHLEIEDSVSVDAIIVSKENRVNQIAIQVIDHLELKTNLASYLELADMYSGMCRTNIWLITDGNNWIAYNSESKEQTQITIFVDEMQHIADFMSTNLR